MHACAVQVPNTPSRNNATPSHALRLTVCLHRTYSHHQTDQPWEAFSIPYFFSRRGGARVKYHDRRPAGDVCSWHKVMTNYQPSLFSYSCLVLVLSSAAFVFLFLSSRTSFVFCFYLYMYLSIAATRKIDTREHVFQM